MKQKVGELYGKPIVVGNPNEFEKHEIPLNDLNEGFDAGMEYYLVLNSEVTKALNTEFGSEIMYNNYGQTIASHGIKTVEDERTILARHAVLDEYSVAFATSSVYKFDSRDSGVQKEMLEYYLKQIESSLQDKSAFKQITAKEYYSLLK